MTSPTVGSQAEMPLEPEALPPKHQDKSRRGLASYALRTLLGVGLLVFIISRIHDRRTLWDLLRRERPVDFLAALAIYLLGQPVAALRWRHLSAMLGITARYLDLILFYCIGAFTNLFVPGLIGGDATRAIYLGRRSHDIGRAVASVLADRLLGLLALVWVTAVSVALLNRGSLPRTVTTPIFLVGAGSVAGYLLMPLAVGMARFMPGRLKATVEMLRPYLCGQIALLPAMVPAVTVHLLQVTCQYVLALGLGLSLPFRLFLLCVPVTNLFTSLPITLGGLGIREGLYVVLFGMLGMGKADATALGLLWFAVATLGGLLDSLAFIVTPSPLKTPAAAGAPATNLQSMGNRVLWR